MRIRMLETRRGAAERHRVETFEAGKEYDLGHSATALDLAEVFLREKWAEKVKARTAAPENKSAG